MYLDQVKARFEELKLVSPGQLLPCTEEEVRAIEQHLGFILPQSYREFLLWMGHGAGDFLRGSNCWYEDLLSLQQSAVELLEENCFPEKLPSDGFVFFMHQGYQFNFLRPYEGDNPPVYFYGEWTNQTSFTVIYQSFSDFLATEIEDHAKLIIASLRRQEKDR